MSKVFKCHQNLETLSTLVNRSICWFLLNTTKKRNYNDFYLFHFNMSNVDLIP